MKSENRLWRETDTVTLNAMLIPRRFPDRTSDWITCCSQMMKKKLKVKTKKIHTFFVTRMLNLLKTNQIE